MLVERQPRIHGGVAPSQALRIPVDTDLFRLYYPVSAVDPVTVRADGASRTTAGQTFDEYDWAGKCL